MCTCMRMFMLRHRMSLQAADRAAALVAEQQAELKQRLRGAQETERALQESRAALSQREADARAAERHLMVRHLIGTWLTVRPKHQTRQNSTCAACY